MTSSHHSPEFDGFIKTIQFDELCAIATSLRGGTEGGENAIFELIFSDDVTWMARIPLSYSCFQPEELTGSYAATLKFLKTHSSIPVPEVYGYQFHSDPSNKVNASYLLMERLPGHPLPVLEQKSLTAEPDPKELALANKVHEQLTDFILQLASFKFDGIGSLREDPNGDFFVAPFVDSTGTAFPKHKVVIYEKLDFSQRGPFHSTSEWYRAVAQLNRQFSLTNPEEEARAEAVGDHELLSEFSDRVVLKEYDHGPFVIHHNDLTVQNILVDQDFNITGILDFPGTIVPLTSLCVMPYLFYDNYCGLVVDRNAFLKTFVNWDCPHPSSALCLHEVRQDLMRTADNRTHFELGLFGPYTPISVEVLFQEFRGGDELDRQVEYGRLAETRPWFKEILENEPLAEDGDYGKDGGQL